MIFEKKKIFMSVSQMRKLRLWEREENEKVKVVQLKGIYMVGIMMNFCACASS